jgi:hypothetical protein
MALFTYAETDDGFTGALSLTKTVGRNYFIAERSYWYGKITGTDADMFATSDFGPNPGLLYASVDGGAFAQLTNVGTRFSIFSLLPDVEHDVLIYIGPFFGEFGYVDTTSDLLDVAGASPAVETYANTHTCYSPSSEVFDSGYYTANSANYLPANFINTGASYPAASAGIRIKTTATEIYVVTRLATKIYVSVDGVASAGVNPTASNGTVSYYSFAGTGSTYSIWGDDDIVSVGANAAFQTGIAGRLDQFGDSITFGEDSVPSPKAEVEINNVASHFNYLGQTYGVSGLTVGQLLADLPGILAASDRVSTDGAVLAIGRNSLDIAFDPLVQADYESIIDGLIEDYGFVICRGIIPGTNGTTIFTAENAEIKAIAEGYGNPNVTYVDPNGWVAAGAFGAINTPDGTHPDNAGYATLENYCIRDYAASIPAPASLGGGAYKGAYKNQYKNQYKGQYS